ncbi:MAG: PEP-CTERM sorting domain-containing protein [bacterium]|nr:PEP-CTERM sorting domain-containing protein [bacterium]
MEYVKRILSVVAFTMILACFANAQYSEAQSIETCNGVDDNGNGAIDENCYSCQNGDYRTVSGRLYCFDFRASGARNPEGARANCRENNWELASYTDGESASDIVSIKNTYQSLFLSLEQPEKGVYIDDTCNEMEAKFPIATYPYIYNTGNHCSAQHLGHAVSNRYSRSDDRQGRFDDLNSGGYGAVCESVPQLNVKKEQTALDRNENTEITDVYRGDWIRYEISATNWFDIGVFMMISDALDRYVDYLAGTLTVNDATLSDSFVSDGLLDYEHTELINPGETLSIGFDVQVSDVAPPGWLVQNVAFITAFIDPLNPFSAWETNIVEVRVESPVPEPSTMLLFAGGLLCVRVLMRKSAKRKK